MSVEKYLQPKDLQALTGALSEMTPGSRVIAGGTDLMIEIKNDAPEIPVLVSLVKVPELKGIGLLDTGDGCFLRIGAMECHAEIAASDAVRQNANALALACDHVGSRQVRNRGTIGGSLGNASVAGDMLPVLYLLDASLVLLSGDGTERTVPADCFLTGLGQTCLGGQEIVKEILIPVRPERSSCFVKLGGRAEVTIAEISLCLSWEMNNGQIASVQGVLGAVDRFPVRLPEAEEILGGGAIGAEACEKLTASLSDRIRTVRLNRKRPPRLRIREGEKEFKERAVRGVVYDAVELMCRTAGTGSL